MPWNTISSENEWTITTHYIMDKSQKLNIELKQLIASV